MKQRCKKDFHRRWNIAFKEYSSHGFHNRSRLALTASLDASRNRTSALLGPVFTFHAPGRYAA